MEGPVFMSPIFMSAVAQMKSHFYQRYVDNTYIRRKKNEPDSLFEKINHYHPK